MNQVVVASQNPVKLNATKIGFSEMFPNTPFSFGSVAVTSGVSDQPMSSEETYKGALNRATRAQEKQPNANYWVGLEGGIEKTHHGMECFAWVVILSKEKQGKARTATFLLPQKLIDRIEMGEELGVADDKVFGRSNSKQNNGAIGLLTQDAVTRTSYYVQAIVLALIPFKNNNLYT